MSNNKNLTRDFPFLWKLVAGLLAGFIGCCLPLVLPAQENAGQVSQVKEYFHQQDASTALMIRIEAFEAGFETRVFDTEGVLIKASGVPALQTGPIFQFIEPVDKPRQLRIEVTLNQYTKRTNIDLRLIRFEPNGPDATTLIKAYRLLSQGLEIERTNHADKWTMKVVSLMQAASIFDFLGMEEMQLWSEFYANYYLLVVLGDPTTAADGAMAIFPRATRTGLKSLALASLQLEGMALVKLAAAGDAKTSASNYAKAQARFREAAELAASNDFKHEEARALYISGLAYEYAGQVDQTFLQFDRVLNIATSIDDTIFANQVRQHAAELHESRGDTTEAIAMLEEIRATAPPTAVAEDKASEQEQAPGEKPDPVETNAQKGKDRSDREMVSYLFEQGRLLEKTFQHLEAAEVLVQALELDQRAPTAAHTGPVTLLLGKALYGAGHMEEAAGYLQTATEKTTASGYRNELEEAYGMLAAIYRERRDFTAMGDARQRQETFLATDGARAAFTYERALDALAADGPSSRSARSLLAESAELARTAGTAVVAQLALLQSCALGDSNTACASATMDQARAALEASGIPAAAFEGRWLGARILRRNGQLGESTAALDRLISDMQFFHTRLPGVLGAWYWQKREQVFTAFMDQTLQSTGAASGTNDEAAALRSLAVLDRLSRIDAGEDAVSQPASGENEALANLRSTYAARAAATDSQQARTLSAQAAEQLQSARSRAGVTELPSGALAGKLRQLPADASFLTYYLSDRQAWAWVGHRNGLSLVKLPWSDHQTADLAESIEGLRLDLSQGRNANFTTVMDILGRALVEPVARQLQGNIYFFAMGSIEGIPLDALRVDGRFLLESHRVTNLVSLDHLAASGSRVESEDLKRFYLAGNRQTSGGDFGAFQPTPAEIRAIADRFVGPGLRIVQGSALHFEEFEDPQFTEAGVLHLAIPGVIDLRQPGESRLMLSDSTVELEQEFMVPGDVARKSFRAKLAVLSTLDFVGTSPSAFDTNTRFVREFLHAGAGSVIASLWTVGDQQAAEFWRRFYAALVVTPDVGEALYQTRKSYLAESPGAESGVWAAFQMFED